ncbi:MAG: type II 3-dehydroquinate dehydratase [Clostridia bacterium]|nr:type II 3-dehydroquinate dehydratase [Clostridia bacterium]
MKVLVVNGPNINFLGIREPEIYGRTTYQDMIAMITEWGVELGQEIRFFQSNHEGALVDIIQEAYFDKIDGIVINPGAYTHTSIAILDALKAVGIPTVEVHLSKVEERESFRQISYVGMYADKTITGKGVMGYKEALEFLKEKLK